MKLYVLAGAATLALGVALLGGCASTQSTETTWEPGNRPQMLMPGALRSDVKGIAMGAARSKGWTIVRSSDDLLVVQRPLEAGSSAALALGAAGSTIPPTIEVTSAFLERPDGVNVALGAELVSQPPGEKAPKRTDITETYRGELNRSLENLRSNWTANRHRVAGAIPPTGAVSEPPPEASSGKASEDPLVRTWAQTVEEEKASKGQSAAADTPAVSTPEPRVSTPPAPAPQVVSTPPQAASPASAPIPTPLPAPAARPAAPPAPARTSSATPAPVVDGSGAVGGTASARPQPAGASSASSVLPPAPVESVPPDRNMVSLSQAGGSGTWAYYAEQYARLRGCNVTEQGALLIESRADGEVHKVPCTGTDSFLVKCRDGVCRGLD